MGNEINENTAALNRASVSKAFGAKPAPEPVKKAAPPEADAKDLQAILGKDVVVKAEKKLAKGGFVKSASARADGCAIRGKTRA